MPKYTVSIVITSIDAENELEARKKFWEIVDDDDYPIKATVKKED